jgi:hypothetical protein
MHVDMSVWCRSAIVDALNNAQKHRDDLLAYQQQLSLMTDHIIRVRALLNADIASRYPDEGAAVAQAADALQARLTGMEMADNE